MNALLLVLCTFLLCGTSLADRILVYNGSQGARGVFGSADITHFYLLFDLDTSEYENVLYNDYKGHKTYGDGAAQPFHSFGVNQYTKNLATIGSATVFASGTTGNMGQSINLDEWSFIGKNSTQHLEGLSGDFAKTLTYTERVFSGTGESSSDYCQFVTGIYRLEMPLTSLCNPQGNSYTLDQATSLVNDHLTNLGY